MEKRSRRFTVTPGRRSGALLPRHFSFHFLRPIFQRARACIADVFPELLGPMKTTGFPSSMSTSPKRLKLRIVRLVNMAHIVLEYITDVKQCEVTCHLFQVGASSRLGYGSSPKTVRPSALSSRVCVFKTPGCFDGAIYGGRHQRRPWSRASPVVDLAAPNCLRILSWASSVSG